MLAILTKYLLQYKRVCIPEIGTFEIIQQAPQLRVADQMMTAPQYRTHFKRYTGNVEEPGFSYSLTDPDQKAQWQHDLASFGKQLKQKIQQGPFLWNGLGTLRITANELVFEPQAFMLESLQKVPAQKVIRPNMAHHMLVGDQETTTQQMSEALHKSMYKKPLLITGWVLLGLSLLAIIVILYVGHFQVTASGLKMKFF